MKPRFTVQLRSFEEIDSIPSAWGPSEYRALLELLDFEDVAGIPDSELQDMVLMALQDLPPDDAAEAVLELRLGKRLTPGQRQELSHEMLEDPVWDEYSDMSAHEELFHASVLLHAAFPTRFPLATAVSLELQIDAENEAARHEIEEITEPLLCRLIADGMPERSILRRLFEQQLRGSAFPEAEHIIWQFNVERPTARQVLVSLLTTSYWASDFRDAGTYSSTALGDRDDHYEEGEHRPE